MKIHTITFSGADETVDPKQLAEISKEFPFVEWGILLSRKAPKPRYPDHAWRSELARLPGLKLSGHFCGAYTRNFLKKGEIPIEEIGPLWESFKRIQVQPIWI